LWFAGVCHLPLQALEKVNVFVEQANSNKINFDYVAARKQLVKANDFVYTQANGVEGTLYTLESEILLLYFYDPTCEDCHELKEQLNTSEIVNQLIDEKRLVILSVYPEDDMDLWMPYTKQIPSNWINGYDKGATINVEGLFLLTSLPTLYLLDEEKNIVLQTTTFEDIEQELEKKIN
jgi:thiol-disulfide isomerase/thioredoxin